MSPSNFLIYHNKNVRSKIQTIVVSISPDNVPQTLKYIDSVVSRLDSEHLFEFRFFDDLLDELYENENNLLALTAILAGVCVLVSSLGLFGLTAFTIGQRTKEIGVRKVLGASTGQILLLLMKNCWRW